MRAACGNVSAFAFDARGRLWVTTSGASDHANDGVYLIPRAGREARQGDQRRRRAARARLARQSSVTSPRSAASTSSAASRARGFRGGSAVIVEPKRPRLEQRDRRDRPTADSPWASRRPATTASSRRRWSATIVSFRPDGSDVRVYARGIRAPFGLAYDRVTGALITSMNQRDDLGARTPGDWLALVRSGQDWRFPGCYGQGGSVCRGVPKPLAVLDRHAAAGRRRDRLRAARRRPSDARPS